MKKSILILLVSVLISYNLADCQTQQKYDVIIKKDNTTVLCNVLKVTDSQIEIKPKEGKPFLIIERSSVESIIYADGTLVKFTSSSGTQNSDLENQNRVKQEPILKDDKDMPLFKFSDGPFQNYNCRYGLVTFNLMNANHPMHYYDENNNLKILNLKYELILTQELSVKGYKGIILAVGKDELQISGMKLTYILSEGGKVISQQSVTAPGTSFLENRMTSEFGSFTYMNYIFKPQISITSLISSGGVLGSTNRLFSYDIMMETNIEKR